MTVRLFISAAHKSSGKTTVTIGLAAAFAMRGVSVQCFKKGPDYIDPMWLARASGRPCFNLDFNTQTHDEITATVTSRTIAADLALIEGNKGLHDGVDPEGSDCSAALAKLTCSPVVLVIDVLGMTRGIAPLLLGYQAFDPDVRIAGVILNKVGPARQQAKLRQAVEQYTDIPVLGALPRDAGLAVTERHLGLMTPSEAPAAEAAIAAMRRAVEAGVDLDRLLGVGAEAPVLAGTALPDAALAASLSLGTPPMTCPVAHTAPVPERRPVRGRARPARRVVDVVSYCPLRSFGMLGSSDPSRVGGSFPAGGMPQGARVRIAIPRDAAFGFYYPDDLEAFEHAGATLCFFDTLSDARLPDADGLFIGGGFPETQSARLAANAPLRAELAEALRAGMPAYAECGGLMYLCRSIRWKGETHEMVGAVPADAVMHDRPQGRGLVRLEETPDMPWPSTGGTLAAAPGHEFHYAALENIAPGQRFAYRMMRGTGLVNGHDGIVIGNLVANFSHLRASPRNPWVERFVNFVRKKRALTAA